MGHDPRVVSARGGAREHEIRHRRPPERWEYGLPLGNGDVGVMFWGDGAPLSFTLDKADLWDLRSNNAYLDHPDFNYAALVRLAAEQRFDEIKEVFENRQRTDNTVGPSKISIGRAELPLSAAPLRRTDAQYDCRLSLASGMVEGTIRTPHRKHRLQTFVHRRMNVFSLRVSAFPAGARMHLVPLAEMNNALAKLNHPKPQRIEDGRLAILLQSIPDGPFCAVAWNPAGPDIFMAIETAASAEEAVSRARAAWLKAAEQGFEALCEEHRRAWEAFWAGAAVYVPERNIEFLWYYGLYLLGSAASPRSERARKSATPPGLQGVWPMDGRLPPWRGDYHANMNVQETFWPACASGHLDLLDCWCDLMKDSLDAARTFTRRFFGTEGTFWPCAFLPRHTFVPCWGPVQLAWSNSGWLGWLVWLRWRYSMDVQWLADTGYPVVAEIFKFYRANLVREADGRLHIPLSSSPEYRENKPAAWCKDPNIDIALIRRCCDWVLEMEQALKTDLLSPAAREVRAALVPYHLTERHELCLWSGKPLDESHRHPSHLMAIHPAMDLTIEDGEHARRIIAASLEQYFSLGQYRWAGHTYAQMCSFAAVLGRGEFAYDCAHKIAEYWLGPNGLHFNRDIRSTGATGFKGHDLQFTIEANCGISAGISDMLVQGWRDTIRLFPAVPEHWRDAAFRDLLTEGAFRVSALRRNGQVVWAKIVAGTDRALRLRNPFADNSVEVKGGALHRDGQDLVGDMVKGQEIVICLAGESTNFEEAAAQARRSSISRLGLR